MKYYFNKLITDTDFDTVIDRVTVELQKVGFGVISTVDVKETFKNKLGLDFKKYLILGACNPNYAYKAISEEDKIGLFLPCNIILTEHPDNTIEVAAIDPVASMSSVENDKLGAIATEIRDNLQSFIDNL